MRRGRAWVDLSRDCQQTRLMRRSEALTVTILCPHFERPVTATRNGANERLVDCRDRNECVSVTTDERGVTVTVYPQACPVFRTGS